MTFRDEDDKSKSAARSSVEGWKNLPPEEKKRAAEMNVAHWERMPKAERDRLNNLGEPVRGAKASPRAKAMREQARKVADKYITQDGGKPSRNSSKLLQGGKVSRKNPNKNKAVTAVTGVTASRSKAKVPAAKPVTQRMKEPDISGPPDLTLLDDLDEMVRRRVYLLPAQRTAVVLWIAHTYVYDQFEYTGRLFSTASKPSFGKSVLLDTVAGFSFNGRKRESATTLASISRMFKAYGDGRGLTLALDQLDGMSNVQRDLINTLCSGCEIGAVIEKCGKGSENDDYNPDPHVIGFPICIGKIGGLPDAALASRCITIDLQPAPDAVQEAIRRERYNRPLFANKVGVPTPWVKEMRGRLVKELYRLEVKVKAAKAKGAWEPYKAPCKASARTLDIWQPLLAVAEHFGPEWMKRAEEAFCEMADEVTPLSETREGKCLKTIMWKLKAEGVEKEFITPEELYKLTQVNSDISKDLMGKLLRRVGVVSKPCRPEPKAPPDRYYRLSHLKAAAERWLKGWRDS